MKILNNKYFYFALLLTFIVSICAKFLASISFLAIFGQLVISLLIGMLLQFVLRSNIENIKPGIAFISNKFLRAGIILLGSKLAIDKLIVDGKKTLIFAFVVVIFMMFITYYLCKIFKVDEELSLLASAGCGICGAAAVMGVGSQINAKTENSVLAVAVVAILGTLFTFIEVSIKPYLNLTDYQYGIFAGSSLHEIAHAVAGGGAGGSVALDSAILMKLSRVLMLVVVIFALSYFRKGASAQTKKPIPYFIFGFVLMSIVGSYVPFVKSIANDITNVAYIFLGMAMCSLGLSVNFSVLKKQGTKVLAVCFVSSFILMVFCYFVAKYIM